MTDREKRAIEKRILRALPGRNAKPITIGDLADLLGLDEEYVVLPRLSYLSAFSLVKVWEGWSRYGWTRWRDRYDQPVSD